MNKKTNGASQQTVPKEQNLDLTIITTQVTEITNQQLRKLAFEKNVSKSEIVRLAIESYIGRHYQKLRKK